MIIITCLTALLVSFLTLFSIEKLTFDRVISKKLKILVLCLSLCVNVLVISLNIHIVWQLYYFLFWNMLIIIGFVDFFTSTIPDIIIYVISGMNFLILIFNSNHMRANLYGAAFGFILYLLIYFAAKAYYKREAFGFGDVILMGSIGLHLGLQNTVLAAFLPFYVALFGILVLKTTGKSIDRKMEIPFGPFMCIAAFIVSLYGDQLIKIYQSFF